MQQQTEAINRVFRQQQQKQGEKLRAFVPGDSIPAPVHCVLRPGEKAPVSGKVRIPRGAAVYGIAREGRFISWAAAWQPDANGIRQITAETDRDERGHGYAADCLCALARDIPEPLLYLCAFRNLPSAKVALKAGFVEIFLP